MLSRLAFRFFTTFSFGTLAVLTSTPNQIALRTLELLMGTENTRQATYIGSQYDPQVKLESFFVLFKYLLLASCTHFAFGLQRDDEMLSAFSPHSSHPPSYLRLSEVLIVLCQT